MHLRTHLTLALTLLLLPLQALADPRPDELAALEQPYTVEYNYRIKRGHEVEFMELYRRNHWPILVADMRRGEIASVELDRARMSSAESHRWDIRVTITFRNVLIPHGLIDRTREPIIEKLYPDRERWEREEQRRFELCDAIMVVETDSIDVSEWATTGQ